MKLAKWTCWLVCGALLSPLAVMEAQKKKDRQAGAVAAPGNPGPVPQEVAQAGRLLHHYFRRERCLRQPDQRRGALPVHRAVLAETGSPIRTPWSTSSGTSTTGASPTPMSVSPRARWAGRPIAGACTSCTVHRTRSRPTTGEAPTTGPTGEGGGKTSTHPFITWRYRYLDGIDLGQEVIIEFVDRTFTGEYRIALDPFEKDALKNTPVADLTEDQRMGRGDDISRHTR